MKTSVALVVLVGLVAFPRAGGAGHYSTCQSTVETAGGVLLVCPAGDGPRLEDIGATIHIKLVDYAEYPVAGMPGEDFWIIGTTYTNDLCHGYLSSSADAPTNAQGETTISGPISGGGIFGEGSYVVAQGFVLHADYCDDPMPLVLVSPDINNDGVVDGADIELFAAAFPGPAGAYPMMDFNGDGAVNNIDFTMLGNHYLHECTE